MIDEPKQDLALAYVLGELSPAQARGFEQEMRADAALTQLVDDLRDSTAALALTVPKVQPSAQLRAKILTLAQGKTGASADTATKVVRWGWLTPALGALAACLALAFLYTFQENQQANTELAQEKSAAENLAQQRDELSRQLAALKVTTDGQLQQIAELQKQGSLALMKITTLSAQIDTYQKAGVVVVWDDQKQQGVIKMVNLPKPGAGKDYQLWIIDPRYQNPVNAGVLPIADETGTLDAFKPDQPVTSATAFAISVEKTGGVPKAEGPIVFVGK